MTDATLLVSLRAALLRWIKLVPGLFRHDPLFRYAAIAAILAVIFLAVGMVRDGGRDGVVSEAGKTTGSQAKTPDRTGQDNAPPAEQSGASEPPAPGSPDAGQPLKIAPGRSLQGVDVTPAPRDSFGTLPTEKEKEGSSR